MLMIVLLDAVPDGEVGVRKGGKVKAASAESEGVGLLFDLLDRILLDHGKSVLITMVWSIL